MTYTSLAMMNLNKLLTTICLLGALLPCIAQQNAFKGGILIGFNAAQIDGDELRGFDKAGLNLGGRVSREFGSRYELSLDLLYSQRGAQSRLTLDNSSLQNRYHLQYIEVPLQFHLKEWMGVSMEEEAFYRFAATAGLCYSRLIRAKMVGNPFEMREDELNVNDYSWMIGVSYYFNPVNSLHLRYTESINLLYDGPLIARPLRGYFLTLQYLYGL
jgi:hypothetical protein